MSELDSLIDKMKAFKEELAKTDGMGVHTGSNPKEPGRSGMGILARLGETGKAKLDAKQTLKEMKSMPKPKLVKNINELEQISLSDNGQWNISPIDPNC
jgi:hypothetical protein